MRMRTRAGLWARLVVGVAVVCVSAGTVVAAPALEETPGVVASVESARIVWYPQVENGGAVLTIAGPAGMVLQQEFPEGALPSLEPGVGIGGPLPDGLYTYQVELLWPKGQARAALDDAQRGLVPDLTIGGSRVHSGAFSVVGGLFVLPDVQEEVVADKALEGAGLEDVLHLDDVIITGSLCTGFDCVNGESFGFDTIRLKENNLRIRFLDTSNSASFPTNDWQLTANDSSNGGASYFAIDDYDGGYTPFKVMAGARTNSLFVGPNRTIGLGTSTPRVALHMVYGNTPTVRLDQDNSEGWGAYVWDVAGNETNFFIRDVTSGSRLPFRIQPSAPSNTLTLRADGKVGIGTWAPAEPLHLLTNSSTDARIGAERTSGARVVLAAAADYGYIGTVAGTGKELRLVTDGSWKMKIKPDGTLNMSDGGSYDGTWNNASSITFKENVQVLDLTAALDALAGLNPVTFSYKAHPGDERVGFIAEEVPELVASEDRQTLSSMDIVAVLTRVVQEQESTIGQLQAKNAELESRLDKLEGLVSSLVAE